MSTQTITTPDSSQSVNAHPRVVAYNYFANYFGWPTLNSLQEVGNNPNTERRPELISQAFLVDGLKLISTIYAVYQEKYYVKIVGSEVTEFYVLKPKGVNKGSITFVSYDINTQKPVEYYRRDDRKETKYDFETDQLKQINYFSRYDNLPESIKLATKDFKYKKYISIYADKPYGVIVECIY